MLSFERIDINSIDWEALDSLPDRTIFQTLPWLKFVAKTQDAEPVFAALRENNQTLGYFTGLIIKKFGFKILGSPFPGWTTAYMGFNLLSGVSRNSAVKALVDFAFHDLKCIHLEFMDRNFSLEDGDGLGFDYRLLSGLEVDLTDSEDAIFANITSSCRRDIRRAARNGIIVEEAMDKDFANDYYAQLKDVFEGQSLVPTYGIERVQELTKHIYPTGRLLLLRARNSEGLCIATGIFPAMNQTMYFWGGASMHKYQNLLPNEAIQWYAMKYWKQRGIRFYDMMGGRSYYKKKYGGYDIAIPWFRKSKYRLLSQMRDISKILVDIRQQMLGKIKKRQLL